MKIIFLHGVGDGDPDRRWLAGLNRGLVQLGASVVDSSDVIAPNYSKILSDPDSSEKNPPITYKATNERQSRRAFHRRQGRVEQLLAQSGLAHSFGLRRVPTSISNRGVVAAASVRPFVQVKNYMNNQGLRGAVLNAILGQIPTHGKVILIAHSLGSVIAIDLLDHLPEGLHVERFVTIGSPAGSASLHKGSGRILKKFPYDRVSDWSNIFDPFDIVTAGRGLASLFPGAQDFSIDTGHTLSSVNYHPAEKYLAHSASATLVGDVLSPTRMQAVVSDLPVRRLEDADVTTLVALCYGIRIAGRIKNSDDAARYDDALKILRDRYVDELRGRMLEGRGLASELQSLVDGRLPLAPRRWDIDETVTSMILLALSNIVAPFEIDPGTGRVDALPEIFVDLGHTSSAGRKARQAIEDVENHLREDGFFTSKGGRIAAAAAGVALIAAAPIGLALAAPAAVAGGAAIVGGLAAFGPGGMVGGLAMLGGLASTGAMITTAAATMRGDQMPVIDDPTSTIVQVTTAHALNMIGGQPDPDLWNRLTISESRVAAEINRLETYSDKKAPTLERMRANRAIIAKLMDFMIEHSLVPSSVSMALSEE